SLSYPFFFYYYRDHHDLHSFSTRRSSDLVGRFKGQVNAAAAKQKMMESGYRIEDVAEMRGDLARLQANHELLLAGTRNEEIEERSEEHTSELQSPYDLVCRLLLEKKKQKE